MLGIERYAGLFRRSPFALTKELFGAQRFLDIRQGDCGYRSFDEAPAYSNRSARRLNLESVGTVPIVGDKITQLYKTLEVFEGDDWAGTEVFVVQIIRSVFEVARSYEARSRDPKDRWKESYVEGIREWSDAVDFGLRASEAEGARMKFLAVCYDRVFEGGEEQFVVACATLLQAIGLDPSPEFMVGARKVFLAGEKVEGRRLKRGELVSNEEIAACIAPRSLWSFDRLREVAFI